MSEVHCVDNDGVSGKQLGISENNDERVTNFPSISNDTQSTSVADERISDVSLTEVENTVEQHVSATSESESYAVIGTEPSSTSDNLSPTKKLNRQG